MATATVLVKFKIFCIASKKKKSTDVLNLFYLSLSNHFHFVCPIFFSFILGNIEHSIFYQFNLIWQVESFMKWAHNLKIFFFSLNKNSVHINEK